MRSQSTHKYVLLVEHRATTANTTQHRPFFLHPLFLLVFMCSFSTKEAFFVECVWQFSRICCSNLVASWRLFSYDFVYLSSDQSSPPVIQ